jgi:hypothetical protein
VAVAQKQKGHLCFELVESSFLIRLAKLASGCDRDGWRERNARRRFEIAAANNLKQSRHHLASAAAEQD